MVQVKKNRRLFLIRKYFPKVLTVSDETRNRIEIEVKETDVKTSQKGNFKECALAKACYRQLKADGVLIGLSYAYIIKGTHAQRYATPATVAREITSFDRNKDFDEGEYHLAPVPKTARLGYDRGYKTKGLTSGTTGKEPIHKMHHTGRVRKVGR